MRPQKKAKTLYGQRRDFTDVKLGKYGYKYLIVFVDTFSCWTEVFPTKHKTAYVVAKKILERFVLGLVFHT